MTAIGARVAHEKTTYEFCVVGARAYFLCEKLARTRCSR